MVVTACVITCMDGNGPRVLLLSFWRLIFFSMFARYDMCAHIHGVQPTDLSFM